MSRNDRLLFDVYKLYRMHKSRSFNKVKIDNYVNLNKSSDINSLKDITKKINLSNIPSPNKNDSQIKDKIIKNKLNKTHHSNTNKKIDNSKLNTTNVKVVKFQKSNSLSNHSYLTITNTNPTSPNKNNTIIKSSNNLKNPTKLNFVDSFFSMIENYNTSSIDKNKYDRDIFKFSKILNLPDITTSDEIEVKYNEIWNNFLKNIQKKALNYITCNSNINYINNFNIPKEENYDDLKKLKKKLDDKDNEIQYLKKELSNKDKCILDLENIINEVNFKKSIDENDSNVNYYSQKQLLRDYKNLSLENKNIRDNINALEKKLKIQTEKESTVMQLLYSLKRKGIPIEEILENEIKNYTEACNNNNECGILPTEDNGNISKISDNSMYIPIYIEPPKLQEKNEKVPLLDLNHINDRFNTEYLCEQNTNAIDDKPALKFKFNISNDLK